MVKFCLFCFSICVSTSALCQDLDFTKIEKLPSTINSEAEENMPLLSPDGKTLYFTRFLYNANKGGKYSGTDIWISEYDARKGWAKADGKKGSLNNKRNNAIVGVSSDGTIVYFMNTSPSKKIKGIYFSKKKNSGWSKPEFISLKGLDNTGFFGMYVAPDFDVIFLSMKGGSSFGQEDLYISLKDAKGNWGIPRNLGESINTKGFEMSPFLSADKKRLYFSSNGHKGYGDADIFYTERLYDSWETWTVPKNLGEKINSPKFDAYFSSYGDSIAFFSSNRTGGLNDIYKSRYFVKDEDYTKDKIFLSESEVRTIFGNSFQRQFTFEGNALDVPPKQRELLYYVGKKIKDTDVKVHVLAMKENLSKEIYQKRIQSIINHLHDADIEDIQISFSIEVPKKNQVTKPNTVELLFYRSVINP